MTASGAGIYNSSLNGIILSVAVSDVRGRVTVVEARHKGASSFESRAACDVFCRLIEGLPLQEAAEHGVIHLIDRLRDTGARAPVGGIVTPRNSGPLFGVIEKLIRGLFAGYLREHGFKAGQNTWNPSLHESWHRKSKADKVTHLNGIIAGHLQDDGLAADSLWVSDIELNCRVIIAFAEQFPTHDKPGLLMRVEKSIRASTGSRLEIYAEEMSDRNGIRRL